MKPRIQTLRKQSLQARPSLSAERALLVTNFYMAHNNPSEALPVQRARAYEYILKNKSLHIGNDELIVGERGPKPKATPTFPEICLHSLDDLEIINSRQKVSFYVDQETRDAYHNIIIPFWKGKTQRDRLFVAMDDDWKQAYKAGIFTEFQEQRAPGHTVAGKKVFQTGMRDCISHIEKVEKELLRQSEAPEKTSKLAQLEAMRISTEAIIAFARRHAVALENLIPAETDLHRQDELAEMITICRRVPEHAPRNFHEALQHYWFIHLGVITELNPWDSFCPGRLDQNLYPFYREDIDRGILSQERARELLQAFWIKFNNHPSPPKMGVTARESNTYTDFSLINLGGLKDDGSNAVNELSFLILDVIEEMRLLQPSSMVQISSKNPDSFVKRALQITRTGFGQPSFFNTDVIIQQLLSQGKSLKDARNGGASGCVETGAFGTEAYTLSGYFNLNKVLEISLHKGINPETGEITGLRTDEDPGNMEALYHQFEKQLQHFIDIKIKGNNIIEELYAKHLPVPFLSLIVDDCITNAGDYNAGGARYNTSYIQGVGLGSVTDNLSSIKKWVYDEKLLSLEKLRDILAKNFDGYEELRHNLFYATPRWGNNVEQADHFAVQVFNSFYNAVNGRPSYRGGVFRINMLPTTCHVYFGERIGAMPDGRLAGEPLSEGISPVQGCDINGPTAVILSAAKIDHIKTGGTLLNQKFAPQFFKNDEALQKLCSYIRTWFKLKGHHIQFNVVNAETLKDAQKHPEKHRDLIVRVAGYSDYFNDLGKSLQNEIIKRTQHGNF
ncbi:MAG: glycyl radical protein [Bacteroidetes bacterium]|nr:MAG: glycyl radical protein [Bacteroidota bacterium]